MKTRKEVAELAAVLAVRQKPHNAAWVTADTMLLCRIGTAAERIATDYCNGGITQEQHTAKAGKLLRRIAVIAMRYQVRFETTGDPRGYCLRMHADGKGAPALRGNTWGGDESGYGI